MDWHPGKVLGISTYGSAIRRSVSLTIRFGKAAILLRSPETGYRERILYRGFRCRGFGTVVDGEADEKAAIDTAREWTQKYAKA